MRCPATSTSPEVARSEVTASGPRGRGADRIWDRVEEGQDSIESRVLANVRGHP